MRKIKFLLFLLISINMFALPDVEEVMEKLDYITELKTDGTANVNITQKKVGEGVKVLKSIYYRRDSDDSFLIIMTSPEVDKGNGYLRVEDNFWMYRRNTRTFQHINRDESIAGTDTSGGDFEERKLSELYKPKKDEQGNQIIEETKLGKIPVYKIELEAKVEDVTYPIQTHWVRQDNYLPLKTQSFSSNGTLMQTSYFLKYTKIRDKYLWVKGMFIDEFEKGNKTMVEIKNISIKDIPDHVFTKAYLENLSK
ncbi:MAG: outer membrane lipoprotein-sorting protein [Fusobacteriota bacterium]